MARRYATAPDGGPAWPTAHERSRAGVVRLWMEATTGFEPVNSGFADRRLRPLGYVAPVASDATSSLGLAAPRGFEPRFSDPKSGVLPLDEGAPGDADSLRGERREWSGRRDSNPRPSPWQGDALPTEPLPPGSDERPAGSMMWCREPDSNWRHRDFQSRALPTELSRPAGAVRTLHHILAGAHKRLRVSAGRRWRRRQHRRSRVVRRACAGG